MVTKYLHCGKEAHFYGWKNMDRDDLEVSMGWDTSHRTQCELARDQTHDCVPVSRQDKETKGDM